MEENKICDDVFEQIKDINPLKLTREQELLIDKLILNKDLNTRCKKYGLCEECKQPRIDFSWCQLCNVKHFQQNFKNWTSKNHEIDKFIQDVQLEAKNSRQVIEWTEYDGFENVKYLAKGEFGTAYEANCKNGFIYHWDSENKGWKRYGSRGLVVLKSLLHSQNITVEFLKQVR